MSVFGAYSNYYNLFYKDKDYVGEAGYVDAIIKKYASGSDSILDFGCGTGLLDVELANLGYNMTGVDISEKMLEIARSRHSTQEFILGDIREVRVGRCFDVIVSLFHVMSYLTTNHDLEAALLSARAHLAPGGLLIFDCWYGPAVLTDLPVVRVKRLENENISVVRIAEPTVRYNENVVDVKYEILVVDRNTGMQEQLRETHSMRYFFAPEIEALLQTSRFEIVLFEEFMTGNQPGPDTWGVVWGCRAIE